MLDTIKQLLGFGPGVDYAALLKQGATILDVRSAGEICQISISITVKSKCRLVIE